MTKRASLIIPAAVGLLLAFYGAQTPAQQREPLPDLPPGVGTAPTPQPEVKTYRRGDRLVEEYRLNNRLYMMKVTPDDGEPYYLVDKNGSGRFTDGRLEPENSVPMWVIKEFSFGARKKPDPDAR